MSTSSFSASAVIPNGFWDTTAGCHIVSADVALHFTVRNRAIPCDNRNTGRAGAGDDVFHAARIIGRYCDPERFFGQHGLEDGYLGSCVILGRAEEVSFHPKLA